MPQEVLEIELVWAVPCPECGVHTRITSVVYFGSAQTYRVFYMHTSSFCAAPIVLCDAACDGAAVAAREEENGSGLAWLGTRSRG